MTSISIYGISLSWIVFQKPFVNCRCYYRLLWNKTVIIAPAAYLGKNSENRNSALKSAGLSSIIVLDYMLILSLTWSSLCLMVPIWVKDYATWKCIHRVKPTEHTYKTHVFCIAVKHEINMISKCFNICSSHGSIQYVEHAWQDTKGMAYYIYHNSLWTKHHQWYIQYFCISKEG